MEDLADLATELKQAREKAGLNKSQLARRIGVSYRTVLSWEQGKKRPTSENLVKAFRACGIRGRFAPEL